MGVFLHLRMAPSLFLVLRGNHALVGGNAPSSPWTLLAENAGTTCFENHWPPHADSDPQNGHARGGKRRG